MGNTCCGQNNSGLEVNDINRGRRAREEVWEKTGTISLREAGLTEYPASAERLAPRTRVLDATGNSLTSLPTFLSALTSLQRLVLSRNSIQALPADLSPLAHLRVLFLDVNLLQALPESLGSLQRLERLSVARNSLRALPPSLGGLARLKQLDVSGNQLIVLPAELGGCSDLEELSAANNNLAALPATLGKLRRLKTVDASGNRLTSVPPALLKGCAALQTLKLNDNPITPEALAATPGYAEFEGRRQGKFSKALDAGVMLGAGGLEEGVDRTPATGRASAPPSPPKGPAAARWKP